MKLVLAAALAALLAGSAAQAQTPEGTNLPTCSRTVTDHCIQRSETHRAAPAKHHRAAAHRRHARKVATKRHDHRAVTHAKARHHARHAAQVKHTAVASAKPKG